MKALKCQEIRSFTTVTGALDLSNLGVADHDLPLFPWLPWNINDTLEITLIRFLFFSSSPIDLYIFFNLKTLQKTVAKWFKDIFQFKNKT